MTREEIRTAIVNALTRIAPEVDPARIDPGLPLRDQFDIDSIDFLNFIVAIHKDLGVDIPERDYPKLTTLNSFINYIES